MFPSYTLSMLVRNVGSNVNVKSKLEIVVPPITYLPGETESLRDIIPWFGFSVRAETSRNSR